MFNNLKKIGMFTLAKRIKDEQRERHELKELFWECTLTCNAKCKHCGSSAEGKIYPGELTTEEIKSAFKQVADSFDASKIMVDVTGGEPLTRKDLFEVMEYATSLGFHWGMTTNGILLNEENIQKLKQANMGTVSISIDGLEKTHDEFRGVPGSYQIILKNIEALADANFLKDIMVTTVVHKKNIDELEELYEIMKGLRINTWRILSIDPIGRANDNKELLLDGKDLKRMFDFIIAKNKLKELRVIYGCSGFLGLKYEDEVRAAPFYCRTGINLASILYNGDLFVCPDVPRIPRLIQGNIKTDNFKDVWENKYKEFRMEDRTKCEICDNCTWWDFCLGGSYHTWNFEENKQNKCPYEMMKNKK